MVQTLKILTDAYISRVIRGQSTLKHVIERYFWNGLGPVSCWVLCFWCIMLCYLFISNCLVG